MPVRVRAFICHSPTPQIPLNRFPLASITPVIAKLSACVRKKKVGIPENKHIRPAQRRVGRNARLHPLAHTPHTRREKPLAPCTHLSLHPFLYVFLSPIFLTQNIQVFPIVREEGDGTDRPRAHTRAHLAGGSCLGFLLLFFSHPPLLSSSRPSSASPRVAQWAAPQSSRLCVGLRMRWERGE